MTDSDLVNHLIFQARKKYTDNCPFAQMNELVKGINYTVNMTDSLRSIAATFDTNFQISINKKIFAAINDLDRYNIVSHEVAHGFAFKLKGDLTHSTSWIHIHRQMGGDGASRHDLLQRYPGLAGRNYKITDHKKLKSWYVTLNKLKKIIPEMRHYNSTVGVKRYEWSNTPIAALT